VTLHLPAEGSPGDPTKVCPEPVAVMAELVEALV